MKICIAQTHSLKGNIQKNIDNHIAMIRKGIDFQADLIVFPELSITGYEPELAEKLACDSDDSIFDCFEDLAAQNEITIGVGMPTNTEDGINISLLIFQPNQKRITYSKQLLHTDELPFFKCGNRQVYVTIKNKKIAFGICYETLQEEHFRNAHKNGADIYIASVAKSQNGIDKTYAYFPTVAKTFQMPILMANAVGYCDNFLSIGQSAVWNEKGELVGQLDGQNQGFLIFDTELKSVKKNDFMTQSLSVEKAKIQDLNEIFAIYESARKYLDSIKIFQWTDYYPTIARIGLDIQQGHLYTLRLENEIVGAIILNEEQDEAYQTIDWQFDDEKVLVIHRLAVKAERQGSGLAKKLMDFTEDFAQKNQYTSIRLDVYSVNENAVKMYLKRDYLIRGKASFNERKYPFYCMEKKVKNFDLPQS
jgi:predicted amidohydrolase/ribosomal protein S18 acetylase RimI-like enzyme